LAALRGDDATTTSAIDAMLQEVAQRGEGVGIVFAYWASAVLNNGLGHYDKAAAACLHANAYDKDPGTLCWTLVEQIEATKRSGQTETATDAYRQLAAMTEAAGTDWALGIQARSHALLSEGGTAERRYREAISHFGKTRLRVDLARTHLLYGEWLRRERRRTAAREQLRTAHAMCESIGLQAFATRAARELKAAGGTVHKRATPARHDELTAQEAQIAQMARDGLSNPAIGTRLFISARTVQYHLRKVFTKLGITSRNQLERVLPSNPRA
jgi:DNA-binding CsgD family transcriptional regulator